jgi:hypothetical protein
MLNHPLSIFNTFVQSVLVVQSVMRLHKFHPTNQSRNHSGSRLPCLKSGTKT